MAHEEAAPVAFNLALDGTGGGVRGDVVNDAGAHGVVETTQNKPLVGAGQQVVGRGRGEEGTLGHW